MSDHEQEQETPAVPSPDELIEAEQDEEPVIEPDEGAAPGDEPEAPEVTGEPSPPEGLSEKELNRALDKLDREAKRHHERVAAIMGSDIEMLLDCPLCDALTPGKVMPSPQTPERFPAVREFMGDAQPEAWNEAQDAHRCEVCNGLGMVATGSRVSGQERLTCTECTGRGWVGSRADRAVLPVPTPAAIVEGNGQSVPTPPSSDPPEVAALKRQGYVVIEPVR